MLLILAVLAVSPAGLSTTRDDFNAVTWYEARETKRDVVANDRISVYFGKFDTAGIGPLRLRILYSGEHWVSATTAIFLVDGTKYVVFSRDRETPGGCEWKHQSGRYGVYESCDIALSDTDPALLAAMASAKVVKVRLQGDSVHDWTVPKRQVETIQKVHAVWTSLRAGVPGAR